MGGIVNLVITDRKKARAILASESRNSYEDKEALYRRYKKFGTVVFEGPGPELPAMTAENCRVLTQLELERLQTWPEGYTKSVERNKAAHALGNGWTAEIIIHIFKFWNL